MDLDGVALEVGRLSRSDAVDVVVDGAVVVVQVEVDQQEQQDREHAIANEKVLSKDLTGWRKRLDDLKNKTEKKR